VICLLPKEIGGGIYSGVITKDIRSQGGVLWYLSSNSISREDGELVELNAINE
jgi:hypothetical protein